MYRLWSTHIFLLSAFLTLADGTVGLYSSAFSPLSASPQGQKEICRARNSPAFRTCKPCHLQIAAYRLHLASRISPRLVVNPESRFRPRRGSPAFQAAGIGMWTSGFPFFCTVGERGRSRTHISRFLLTKGKKSLAVLFPFILVFFCFFGLGLFCPFFSQLAICTKKRDAYQNARPAENRTLALYYIA